MNCAELNTSELNVIVGNNEAGDGPRASHRAGYNGIWSLTSVHNSDNCFVPFYAGLNLEHCMDDLFMTDEGGDIFEPRHAPMRLTQVSASSVRLTQEPTPLTGIASETRFEVIEPHAIDMWFRATLHRPPRSGQWSGFFWASYINAPDRPALHFRDGNGMLNGLSPDRHGSEHGANTVCHQSIESPSLRSPGPVLRRQSRAFVQRPALWPAPDVRLSGGREDAVSPDVRPAPVRPLDHVPFWWRIERDEEGIQPGLGFSVHYRSGGGRS